MLYSKFGLQGNLTNIIHDMKQNLTHYFRLCLIVLFAAFLPANVLAATYASDNDSKNSVRQIDGIWYKLNSPRSGEATVRRNRTINPNTGYPNLIAYSGEIVVPQTITYQNKTYTVSSIAYASEKTASSTTSICRTLLTRPATLRLPK